MESVIAGAIGGYAMGMVTVLAATFAVYRLISREDGTQPLEESGWRSVVGAGVFGFSAAGWTVVGTALGAVFTILGLEDASLVQYLAWALGVTAVAWLPLPLLYLLFPRGVWFYGSLGLLFVLLFGVGLPAISQVQ